VAFKYFALLKIDRFNAIVINYVVCVVTGLIFLADISALKSKILEGHKNDDI
jgi:hypothetical protein